MVVKAGMHCFISGRVQGVFFRASAQKKAVELDIVLRATNLDDGRVEVIASGDAAALADLRKWLWQGSQYALVNDVECRDVGATEVEQLFRIGFVR